MDEYWQKWYGSLTWQGKTHYHIGRCVDRYEGRLLDHVENDRLFEILSVQSTKKLSPFCWVLGHFPLETWRSVYCATCGERL